MPCPHHRLLSSSHALIIACSHLHTPSSSPALIFTCPHHRLLSSSHALIIACSHLHTPASSLALIFTCPNLSCPPAAHALHGRARARASAARSHTHLPRRVTVPACGLAAARRRQLVWKEPRRVAESALLRLRGCLHALGRHTQHRLLAVQRASGDG
jgi:hypothetical protein